MNYSGDLQVSPITYKQANAAIQIGLGYQLTDKINIRATYLAGQVGADDKLGTKNYYLQRNLNFKSIVLEGSLAAEYDIFSLHDRGWTPYVFAGIGYYYFNPYTHDTAGRKFYLQPYGTEGEGLAQYPDRKFYSLYQFSVPAGFGLKYAVSDRVTIGFEVGFRKLFTDYLDDVSTSYPNEAALLAARGSKAVELSFRQGELSASRTYKEDAKRGNPGSQDYYYTGLARFTYNIGGGGGDNDNPGGKRNLRCPKVML